ncbi:MAG: PhoH family protein, partial [Paracoccaceae bacterium]|nr:PhoH family protein [Paracoccaceae bacterium]
MIPTTADKIKNKEEQDQTNLKFSDNKLLIDLCGEFDKNLAEIEQKLSVQIVRRGNELNLFGDEISRAHGKATLEALYTRLEAGKSLDTGDLDRELRQFIDLKEMDYSSHATEQIEMFKKSNLEIKTRKKTIEPRTNAQKSFASSLFNNELVFGIGPAGTGKTYLAVAVAVSKFINGEVDRIVLSRPAVEAGEKLGYLPGDMKDKIDPYMQPLYDSLKDMIPSEKLKKYMEDEVIQIAPLAFMRGRTLDNAFVILDEGQNTTHSQMKMFLTRMGMNAKFMVTGDPGQVDLPGNIISGLKDALLILN